jgi:hypothetical protein
MDRLTQIEANLATQILKIDKTLQPGGYTYYNNVILVNEEDETIAVAEDAYPVVNIYMDPEEIVLSGVSRAFQNKAKFKLTCKVENDVDTSNPKFTINKKMSEIVSDLKQVLSLEQATLGRSVDNVAIKKIIRKYNTGSNDNFRTGDVDVLIEVTYSQSRTNPDINACV